MDGNELPGIPTGFDTLDMASGGWQPENFGVIGAAPKRFKTAILMWMALAAARAGYHATVVTFEMSIKELMDRIFCLGGARQLHEHPARQRSTTARSGKLDDFRDEFKSWDGDIEIIHDVAAVTTLAGLRPQIRNRSRRARHRVHRRAVPDGRRHPGVEQRGDGPDRRQPWPEASRCHRADPHRRHDPGAA